MFLISPKQWQAHDDAACKVDFWLRSLKKLQAELGKLNIPLLVRYADTWQQAPQALAELCASHSVEAVHFNDEYGVNESLRDEHGKHHLSALGLRAKSYLDQLLFAPGSISTQAGSMPKVFSQFRKRCQ